MAEVSIPNLTGKSLLVMFGSCEDGVAYVESPRLEVQADRLFITGQYSAGVTAGLDGVQVSIAWDTINAYFVFDSPEELREAVASWQPKTSWFGRS